jgi:hypothetical protein
MRRIRDNIFEGVLNDGSGYDSDLKFYLLGGAVV